MEREGARNLAERLRERREEIEQTLVARVYAISDPAEVGDPEYALGLRTAIAAALQYALACLGQSETTRPPLPDELPVQARAAARAGVSLDTVLRRYFAGYTLLTDCLVREARDGSVDLAEAMRAQAELFDRLIATVTEAYVEEAQGRSVTTGQRRAELVRRLLAGELVDARGLGYELGEWHLGIVASGPGITEAIRDAAARLDRRLLLVHSRAELIWAWLGARQRLETEELLPGLGSLRRRRDVQLAIGEPGRGALGWRLTHRQALAAFPMARRGEINVLTYSDGALLASVWKDDLLAESLRKRYMTPLADERDGGAVLRATLRAYIRAGRHVTSTAVALRVSRQTVNSRLRTVEERVGRPLDMCWPELGTALRLRELEHTGKD